MTVWNQHFYNRAFCIRAQAMSPVLIHNFLSDAVVMAVMFVSTTAQYICLEFTFVFIQWMTRRLIVVHRRRVNNFQ
jgi:hypothetical protein